VNFDDYVHPRLAVRTLDTYLMRSSILSSLRRSLPRLSGVLVDVGCGYQPYRPLLVSPSSAVSRYIGLDLLGTKYGNPDVAWDGVTIPMANATVDAVLLTEVLEHCACPGDLLGEVHRILRPGGVVFLTVPFIWPLHDVPQDQYRLTPFAVARLLEDSGFARPQVEAHGGWDAAVAQLLGLWVRRRLAAGGLRGVVRALLSAGFLPIIRLLAWIDRPPRAFPESTMITGLSATAEKR
jgi:SAM-dependent methyltransferase